MTDLMTLTALGEQTPRTLSLAPYTISENSRLGLASLALARGAKVPAPFGLTLPEPGGWYGQDGYAAIWIAPDQWLVLGERMGDTDFAAMVGAQAPQTRVSEQTDGWVSIEIEAGETALSALLERLVNLPTDATQTGRATRTGLHHMSVFVIRPAKDRLVVMGMRSMAGSLWHAIETTVRRLI